MVVRYWGEPSRFGRLVGSSVISTNERRPIDKTKSRNYLVLALCLLLMWSMSVGLRLYQREQEKATEIKRLEEELRSLEEEKQKQIKQLEKEKAELKKLQSTKPTEQVRVASSHYSKADALLNSNNVCVVEMKKVFPKHLWKTAAAIMLAESGARPNAIGGPNYNGTYDYGCWQINNTKRALNPAVGTQIAWYKYNHSGWSPWVVYKTGAYKRFL